MLIPPAATRVKDPTGGSEGPHQPQLQKKASDTVSGSSPAPATHELKASCAHCMVSGGLPEGKCP